MKTTWRTLWQHTTSSSTATRSRSTDCRRAASRRVYFVYRGLGDTPERHRPERRRARRRRRLRALRAEHRLRRPRQLRAPGVLAASAAASTGSSAPLAPLPWRLRFAAWRGEARGARLSPRSARDELAGCVARWPLEGPQTWEDRKRRRIERKPAVRPRRQRARLRRAGRPRRPLRKRTKKSPAEAGLSGRTSAALRRRGPSPSSCSSWPRASSRSCAPSWSRRRPSSSAGRRVEAIGLAIGAGQSGREADCAKAPKLTAEAMTAAMRVFMECSLWGCDESRGSG